MLIEVGRDWDAVIVRGCIVICSTTTVLSAGIIGFGMGFMTGLRTLGLGGFLTSRTSALMRFLNVSV